MSPRIIQKALLLNSDGKLLLVRRSTDDRSRPGDWDLPGGGFDAGERIEDSIAREIVEETGLEPTMLQLLGVGDGFKQEKNEHRIFLNWGAFTKDDKVLLSTEHSEYCWVSPEDAVVLLGESGIWERVISLLKSGIVAAYQKNTLST